MPFRAAPPDASCRSTHAFSLVEVALALGIAGFVLVGLIGAIPLASSVGRQSIEQNRAISIAGTIFASLRAGKFGAETLLDDGSDAFNMNTLSKTSAPKTYYAYFDEVVASTSSDERKLHFASAAQAGATNYQVTLHFDNNPTGTLAYPSSANHAQANAVEVSIHAVARPADVYLFSSVVANRME